MSNLNKELTDIKMSLKDTEVMLCLNFPGEAVEIRREQADLFLQIRRLVNTAYAQGKEDARTTIEKNFNIIKKSTPNT